jgi:hypothetical protein
LTETYHDYIPANARIVIDYAAKQKVKFTYPVEWTFWKAVNRRGLLNYVAFWIGIHVKIVQVVMAILALPVTIFVGWRVVWSFINEVEEVVTTETVIVSNPVLVIRTNFLWFTAFFCYFFLPPIIVCYSLAFFNKELFSRLTPSIGKWVALLYGNAKQKVFVSEEVLPDNSVLIANFKNFFLDYEATEEFSKYLVRVEILEFQQQIVSSEFFRFWRLKSAKSNEWFWYARFFFSQKPTKGQLKVVFA